MMSLRSVLARCVELVRGKSDNDPRLPSLVRALQKVAPRSVVKEVVSTSGDRRQWGVLTAAWLGVSERELSRAVAKEMKLEFVERPPRIEVGELIGNRKALLDQFKEVGAVPVFLGPSVDSFIVVDPAEIRSLTMFTGKERVALGCWSDIARVLEEAIREAQEQDSVKAEHFAHKQDELCARVLETLLQEATAHGALSLEVVTIDGATRYQFVTADGRRGRGAIHKGIIAPLCRYLAKLDGQVYRSGKAGEVFVRNLGSLTDFKLTWAAASSGASLKVETPHALPEPRLALDSPPQSSTKLPKMQPAPFDDAGASPVAQLSTREVSVRIQESTLATEGDSVGGGDPILVVDDNGMFCRVLEKLLKRDGFAPSFAEDGIAAMEKLAEAKNFAPIAIVCDLHMPRMNGKEFVSTIRNDPRWRGIPIVMLTSDEDVEVELTLLNLGVSAFVSKSKDPRVLAAQVRRVARERGEKVAA